MTAAAVRADARRLPLPDASVDLIITSPPYFALRSYRDGGDHYDGQVGSEPTPQAFLEALWEVSKEAWRVLKPTGSFFVNLGDKRSQRTQTRRSSHQPGMFAGKFDEFSETWAERAASGAVRMPHQNSFADSKNRHVREKSKMLLPHRFAIGCEDGLADPEGIGWIVRQDMVWNKPNGLPESVTDRVRDSHEFWFHLTKQGRYFSAVDEIRQAHTEVSVKRAQPHRADPGRAMREGRTVSGTAMPAQTLALANMNHPLGKLPGSVWTIPSEPLTIPEAVKAHYALPDHFACVDEATEVLTRRGWLRHDALDAGDEVAGYDLETGLARWTPCLAVHRYDYDGEMVAVEKHGLSMRLTPNHRAIVRRPHSVTPLVDAVVDARDLGPRHAIPRSAPWQDGHATKSIGVDLAALCGWIAAEGYYQDDIVRLSQSVTANPEKVVALDALLGRFPYRLADRGGRSKYRRALGFLKRTERRTTYRGRPTLDIVWRLPLWLGGEVQRLMSDKLLGEWALDLPRDERLALLEAFIDGDGHRRPDGRIGIFQKERRNLDVLQAVAVTLGYKTTLRRGSDKWVLYLTTGGRALTLRGTSGTNSPIPREHYRGIVWCPTTGTGTFVARRNGSVFITGNSFPQEWPRRLILGWSPSGVCTGCGEGRRPVVAKAASGRMEDPAAWSEASAYFPAEGRAPIDKGTFQRGVETTITGYACACTPYTDHRGKRDDWKAGRHESAEHLNEFGAGSGNAVPRRPGGFGTKVPPPEVPAIEYHLEGWTPPPTRPAVVVDIFGGTGTVAGVARQLGRVGLSFDLSHDYSRLAAWVLRDGRRFAKTSSRTDAERQGRLI